MTNGLNQQVTIGGGSASWDSKGNLTADPTSSKGYGYSSENLLTSSTGGTAASLGYDPAMRLYQVAGAATARFAYDGVDAIAEYDGSSNLARRTVFDPTAGQPVLQYEGTGTATPKYLSQDERGSIISSTDSSGTVLGINAYDEYGRPGASNTGRFQYTGQRWISEVGLYDYKARNYLPRLGIFGQTDPVGYAGGANLYAYVVNDPINLSDPSGLQAGDEPPIFIFGCQNGGSPPLCIPPLQDFGIGGGPPRGGPAEGGGGGGCIGDCRPIVITGSRSPQRGLWRDFMQGLRTAVCSLPTISIGGGGDFYAIAGVSVGGGVNLDFAKGRFGVSAYTGVGLGIGADAGYNLGGGPSGGGIISGNLAVTGGFAVPIPGAPGFNLGSSATYNILGTDKGWSGGGIGRAGTPLLYGNFGGNIGFNTPSLYDLDCG